MIGGEPQSAAAAPEHGGTGDATKRRLTAASELIVKAQKLNWHGSGKKLMALVYLQQMATALAQGACARSGSDRWVLRWPLAETRVCGLPGAYSSAGEANLSTVESTSG